MDGFKGRQRAAKWRAAAALALFWPWVSSFALAPPPLPEDSEWVLLDKARMERGVCLLSVRGSDSAARELDASERVCATAGELEGKRVEIRFEMAPRGKAACEGDPACKPGEFVRRVYFAKAG
jgi:hypothetical protein